MKKKLYKIVVVFLLCISLSFNLFSCYRTHYKFMHDLSEISKIELVECGFGIDEDTAYDNVLVTIDDVNAFIDEFSNIKYKKYLYNGAVFSFKYSDFGIKVTYENGDYEIIDSSRSTKYYAATDEYSIYNPVGEFNEEQYDSLLRKYLSQCVSPVIYFMHDVTEIEKIEIVDAYAINDYPSKADEYVQDRIAEVDNIMLFIDQMNHLKYEYQTGKNVSMGRFKKIEHRNAIKIYYVNGDYEIIDNNWRDFYIKRIDEYVNNAYIGEFDANEFSSFLEETINNNRIIY